jgi:hypothetical protein
MKTLTKKNLRQAHQSFRLAVCSHAIGSFSASHYVVECAAVLGVRIVAHDVGASIDICRAALRAAEQQADIARCLAISVEMFGDEVAS